MSRAIGREIVDAFGAEWHDVEADGYRLHVDLDEGGEPALVESVQGTLADPPRWLHFRWLYDARGSEIYEHITEQPEYYPTRTEDRILAANAATLRDIAGDVTLVELGSGSSAKTRHLLEAWLARGPAHYVPVDISRAAIESACRELAARYSDLAVEGLVARYSRALPVIGSMSPLLLVFLGSSIGNFNDEELDEFLGLVSASLNEGDLLLLGIDLIKDEAILNAAYNDAAGWTERFIVNVLVRINRELGTAIPLDAVEYDGVYSSDREQVEMSLRFVRDVTVRSEALAEPIHISAGESVLVEVSRKFSIDGMADKLGEFGFRLKRRFVDEQGLFAVLLLTRAT